MGLRGVRLQGQLGVKTLLLLVLSALVCQPGDGGGSWHYEQAGGEACPQSSNTGSAGLPCGADLWDDERFSSGGCQASTLVPLCSSGLQCFCGGLSTNRSHHVPCWGAVCERRCLQQR